MLWRDLLLMDLVGRDVHISDGVPADRRVSRGVLTSDFTHEKNHYVAAVHINGKRPMSSQDWEDCDENVTVVTGSIFCGAPNDLPNGVINILLPGERMLSILPVETDE